MGLPCSSTVGFGSGTSMPARQQMATGFLGRSLGKTEKNPLQLSFPGLLYVLHGAFWGRQVCPGGCLSKEEPRGVLAPQAQCSCIVSFYWRPLRKWCSVFFRKHNGFEANWKEIWKGFITMLFHYYGQPTQATKLFSTPTLVLAPSLCGFISKVIWWHIQKFCVW